MLKNSKLIISALIAVLTIGAATFALAEKGQVNCCVTKQLCCQTQKSCCK
jgi:hypothetical protein